MDEKMNEKLENIMPPEQQAPEITPLEAEEIPDTGAGEVVFTAPWVKILIGAVIVFLLAWGGIALFNSIFQKPVVDTEKVANISGTQRTIATNQAEKARSILGTQNYNQVLQPQFSLQTLKIVTANDPKLALLQALTDLDNTVEFDVLAHLNSSRDRASALNIYASKLTNGIQTVEGLLTTMNARSDSLNQEITALENENEQVLPDLNRLLVSNPSDAQVLSDYAHYVKISQDKAALIVERQLVAEVLNQVNEVMNKANKRLENITLNRSALLANIQIVNTDDKGLNLISPNN